MTKSSFNLQDFFLNQLRKDNTGVTIFLVNGFQIKGFVRGFDSFTVVMDVDGNSKWYITCYFYHHAQ